MDDINDNKSGCGIIIIVIIFLVLSLGACIRNAGKPKEYELHPVTKNGEEFFLLHEDNTIKYWYYDEGNLSLQRVDLCEDKITISEDKSSNKPRVLIYHWAKELPSGAIYHYDEYVFLLPSKSSVYSDDFQLG